jgi:hypothetical protein
VALFFTNLIVEILDISRRGQHHNLLLGRFSANDDNVLAPLDLHRERAYRRGESAKVIGRESNSHLREAFVCPRLLGWCLPDKP